MFVSQLDEEASKRNLKLWKCNSCSEEFADVSGYYEGGTCICGGYYEESGETHNSQLQYNVKEK